MTSFSSLLSSINGKSEEPIQAAPNPANPSTSAQSSRKPNGASDRFKLTPNNTAAGVKRRSEEPEAAPSAKVVKTEQNGVPNRSVAPNSRFQLSGKAGANSRPSPAPQRPTVSATTSTNPAKPVPKPVPRPGSSATPTPTPPGTADGSAKPKKGFAAILERAKATAAVMPQVSAGGIKHKPVEKLTKRERLRLREEELARRRAGGKKGGSSDRSRSGTPIDNGERAKKMRQEVSYQGTMKKVVPKKLAPEPLAYRGTMRAAGTGPPAATASKSQKKRQERNNDYVDWSDLDDAEDDEQEEGEYESDVSDDMEGGFDDVQAEEAAALRAAKKEDQEALEEEERLKREKAERVRKLQALSKSAAAKKKY